VFVGIVFVLLFMMWYDAVEMIKQFPERYICRALSFHGDDVYIASSVCVIQWNVVIDTIIRLEGYSSLTFFQFCAAWL
jgi:hypothetical protein